MLEHRHIQSSDFATISKFAQSAEELFYIAPFADYPWDAEHFAESTTERLSNTVFTDNGSIVGFANFYDFEIGQQGFIGNVIVSPACRRHGVGKQILQHMIETGFKAHRFKEIHLSCFSANTPGLLLYRKIGFKPYAIEQRTDYKNTSVALVNFKLNEAEYRNNDSGLELQQIAAKLADI